MNHLVEQFSDIPARQQTLEMCEEAIQKDGRNIQYVAKRFLTPELCVKAVEQNIHAFFDIKGECLSFEAVIMFFKKLRLENERYTSFFLKKFMRRLKLLKKFKLNDYINKDRAIEMAKAHGVSILVLPTVYADDKDVIVASLDTYGRAIERIHESEQTKEMILKAIKGNAHPRFVSDYFMEDDEIIDAIIPKAPYKFSHAPKEKRTYERCLLAVQHGLEFKAVPIEYYSQEIFDGLVTNKRVELGRVPEEFLTKGLIKKAIMSGYTHDELMTLLPGETDEELAYLAVCQGHSLGLGFIYEHQSERIIKKAVEYSSSDAEYIKPELLTKELVECLVRQNPETIRFFSKELLSEELLFSLLQNDWRCIEYIPKDYLTPNIAMTALELNPKVIDYLEL